MNSNEPPSIFLPGMRQPQQHSQQTNKQRTQSPTYDRSIDPGDLQAMLMKRIMQQQNGASTDDVIPRLAPPNNSATLYPGYSVYRCVDEDHKLMREVGRTDQLGHLDQFIVAENIVQGLILDSSLSVIDLGKEGSGARKINLVPIKTPPMSNMGTLFVEEAAVNRSNGRSLSGQPRRAGNLLID